MVSQKIKRNGNSLCVILDKGVLEKVYGLHADDDVDVNYDFPEIVVMKARSIKKVR